MSKPARLGRNLASITVAQLAVQVLTFILSVALARTFSENLYGLFVFGFAFPSLLLLIESAGLDDVIAVDVAADQSLSRSYLTIVATVRLILALVVGVLLWVSVITLFDDPSSRAVILVLGISALVQTFAGTFLSFFRAFERLEFTALVLVVERGFTIGVAFVLLSLGYGLLEIALCFLVGAAISLALAMFILRRRFTWFSPTFDRAIAGRVLRRALPFALGGLTSAVILGTGPVLLTMFRTTADTGLFNAGFALLLVILSMLTLCHFVLVPTLSRIRSTHPEQLSGVLAHSQRFAFAFCLPLAIGVAFYAKPILIWVFGPAFAGAGDAFSVLVVAAAVSSGCIGNAAMLAASGRQTENLSVGCIGAVAQVSCSLVLIPVYGPLGAAVGFVVGTCIMGFLGTLLTRRLVVRVDLWTTFGRSALAGSMMAIVLVLLGESIWVGVPLSVVVYFASLVVLGGLQERDWGILRDTMRGPLGRGG